MRKHNFYGSHQNLFGSPLDNFYLHLAQRFKLESELSWSLCEGTYLVGKFVKR